MEQSEKSKLFDALNEKKGKIRELHNQLNAANSEKEKWFTEKTRLNQKISALIKDLKQDKTSRDSFTSEVKNKKEERNSVNSLITQKIEEVKKLNQEKSEIVKKYDIKGDPAELKSQMDRLDHKIETEVMSFAKETEIMKMIKELRARYEEAKKVSGVWEKINALSKEIDELKKKSDTVHKDIQSKAKESQGKHESLINASEEVKKISVEENAAFEKFVEAKKKFVALNDELHKEMNELESLQKQVGEMTEKDNTHKANSTRSKLKELESVVLDKIKTGKKLTTEDILVMQEIESKH
ncbi:MAG: hypothetical protein WC471_05870 [Candidatus Woesearchaeota archaeon]